MGVLDVCFLGLWGVRVVCAAVYGVVAFQRCMVWASVPIEDCPTLMAYPCRSYVYEARILSPLCLGLHIGIVRGAVQMGPPWLAY